MRARPAARGSMGSTVGRPWTMGPGRAAPVHGDGAAAGDAAAELADRWLRSLAPATKADLR